MCLRLLALLALLTVLAHGADNAGLTALLSRPILAPGTPLAEVQAFTEQRVATMPAFTTLAEWQRYAEHTRREVLEKIVFRGDLARQWRDAETRVEWLDVIPGGPGYSIRKLRYEALPGLWIPALLYLPDHVSGKIPVHLAVNGHDKDGKAAPYKQLRCINLAQRGIASLNVEWFGQGQLRSEGFGHYRMNQLDLCGVSGLAPFYLAMSRALDALLALPYADPTRVAVSGLSGGGWQTIVISALDTRVTLANPVAGYSSYRTRARHVSDLGDSEQTPNDLATVADYTHLTALLAGRTALLTYNDRDNCCFATPHALAPLFDAAAPLFRLHGQEHRLRIHTNADPGTHNFEVDNRQALYRMVGDTFFPGDAAFDAQEIPSQPEVKTAAELEVPLPPGNLDFTQLALAAAQQLPRKGATATHEQLTAVVKFTPLTATATRTGSETRDGVQATFWKLRLGDTWTVPVTELTRTGATHPTVTTILVADTGRKTLAARSAELLATGQRVLAVDPFYFGESKIAQRDFLFALLVAAVGDRPLGLQSSQLAAAARWAVTEFRTGSVALESTGPRLGLAALVATALEPRAIATLRQTDALPSLHDVLRQNWTVDKYPELFCFGLLESFDLPELKRLAGPVRLK
ncbi:MAG: acetylxylan esterase [Opitutaceae bacterium]|nr:acetylxylan esterase [Opitutaceae bacterium]